MDIFTGYTVGVWYTLVLVRPRCALFESRRRRIEDVVIARHARVFHRRVHEPQTIVLDARAYTFTTRLVPPVLSIALRKLASRGADDVAACDGRVEMQNASTSCS